MIILPLLRPSHATLAVTQVLCAAQNTEHKSLPGQHEITSEIRSNSQRFSDRSFE